MRCSDTTPAALCGTIPSAQPHCAVLAPSVTNHMEAYLNAPWWGNLVGDASRGSGGPKHLWKLVAPSQPRVQQARRWEAQGTCTE